MKINWFTFIAQIINFLILVWLLKRYLYKPILDAIDEREKRIASQLDEAEASKAEAKREKDEFRQKNEEFEKQKGEMLGKVVAESEEKRQRLLEKARTEANSLHLKLDEELKETRQNMNQEVAQKIRQEVIAISRKTLSDLASMTLEEQTANIFIKRLNELNDEQKKQFISAFKSGSNPIMIRSAFELPNKIQSEIQESVKRILGTKPEFQFSKMPDLICGIDLMTNGYKLEWSLLEYLNSLEKTVSEQTQEK
jgi:F-type H+-transporting ATPase subunit b